MNLGAFKSFFWGLNLRLNLWLLQLRLYLWLLLNWREIINRALELIGPFRSSNGFRYSLLLFPQFVFFDCIGKENVIRGQCQSESSFACHFGWGLVCFWATLNYKSIISNAPLIMMRYLFLFWLLTFLNLFHFHFDIFILRYNLRVGFDLFLIKYWYFVLVHFEEILVQPWFLFNLFLDIFIRLKQSRKMDHILRSFPMNRLSLSLIIWSHIIQWHWLRFRHWLCLSFGLWMVRNFSI